MTRAKLYLTQLAFAVPAVLLGYTCFAVYENSGGDRTHVELGTVWVATQLAAYYTAHRAAIAVLRRKHPTWNGKIPKWGAKFETKTEDEETSIEISVMPTINIFSLVVTAFAVVGVILWRIANSFYEQWRGDNLESDIVGLIAVFAFTGSGAFAGLAVLHKKYPTWDGRTLAKNATSKTDRDITKTKLFVVLGAFGVLATVLWFVCVGVYGNNFAGGNIDTGPGIVLLAALPVVYCAAYKVAIAVLRKKHPTWNGKIPKLRAKFETK